RHADNPIFRADSARAWERHKVTACQVVRHGGWYVMFYIGFRDVDHAQIGLARSRDGISGWERHPANPILRPGVGKWTPTRSTSRSPSPATAAGGSGPTAAAGRSSRSAWRSTRETTSASPGHEPPDAGRDRHGSAWRPGATLVQSMGPAACSTS